jgi:hypothetical protein
VEYQGYQAYFGIEDGKITEGEFPPKLTSIVRDWSNEQLTTNQKNFGFKFRPPM